ncbi:hypothetical protein PspLS_07040 [Pyricularia sp. CBS 133598]|nr:hypothetical protein PspLS_07040 [Pyricularia sp. CBS 133598]
MQHLLALVENDPESTTPQQLTSTGHRRIICGPNASRCESIQQHAVYKRVEELCLPPFFTRKLDYEELGTIRPERPEFRKVEHLPCNEIWANTILKISKAILRHPSNEILRGTAPAQNSPSFELPFYSGYDAHETGQLLDQAIKRIIEPQEEGFFSQDMGVAALTFRGISAILYQHGMVNDVCRTQLPEYTANPPPPSPDEDWCPTSRLDIIATRMEESPLLNERREILPKIMEFSLGCVLLRDYEVDGEVRIRPNTQDLDSFHSLVDDAIAFASNFPYAVIESRHLITGFATFMMEINKFCARTWGKATVIFEDILHMLFALRTAIYDDEYRPIVRDMVIAATADGTGEDEETDPGVTNPERAMRATVALQRKLSVDFNVLVNFAIDDDTLHHLLLNVIEGVANMMNLPINADDIKPGPRKLLETGPEDLDDDLRKVDPENVSIKPAELLSLWELW